MKHRVLTLSGLLVLLVLSACGGGGGGGQTGLTPSNVSSTSPAADATGVEPGAVVTASFNEDILGTSVDGSSFTLQDNQGPVTGTVSFDGANNVATLTPAKSLSLLDTYTATLTTAVTDLSGNGLAADYTWHFTTRDGAWQSAQLIETDNAGDAASPQVAVDAAGNALAVWQQSDGTRINIWANRYTAGSGWGSAVLIETDNAGDAYSPQVTVDAAGNALAVWYQSDGTRSNIWANRYTVGSGWGNAVLIETDNAGDAYSPQVTVDAAGNALAVWYQSDGTRSNIWANRYTVGSGWGNAALIETDNAGDAFFPQVAVDAAGNALVVWYQSDGIRYNIWANRYTAGSGWGTAALIETDTGEALFPQVAVDAAGNALAVWYQSDGTRYNIWANRYTAGSGWGSATLIETDNAGNAVNPHVAFDAAGNALAVWDQLDGTRYNIWANRYTVDSGWGSAALIETDNTGSAAGSQVAVDAAGNALAVWHQSDGTRDSIRANRYTAGSGWGNAALIETNAGGAVEPQVAFDAAGNALAVWYQSDGTRNYIWANRYTLGSGWGSAARIETNAGDVYSPQVAVDAAGNALAVWNQSDGIHFNIWANRFE